MLDDEGGGASRSTDPAAGSSAATDVSLREYLGNLLGLRIEALDRHLTSEIAALRRETQTANVTASRAIDVAADEAKQRLEAHNGLIEQMRRQAELFASRESVEENKKNYLDRFARIEGFQARMFGGMAVIGVIGVANLTKLWFG